MTTRGVLLDVARFHANRGDWDPGAHREIGVDDLEAVRSAAGVAFERGDVLLLRTGWLAWYRTTAPQQRARLAADGSAALTSPGLAAGEEMAEYLWDSGIAAIAADNPALEAWPHAIGAEEFLHFRLIALLGMTIGELWDLDALADACAADSAWDFLLASAPLNVASGVGSVANALAVR